MLFLWSVINYISPGPSSGPAHHNWNNGPFGGVGRVPIAVTPMVTEMTGSLAFIVPPMVAVVSYFLDTPKFTIYQCQVLSIAIPGS